MDAGDLIGSWELASCELARGDGEVSHPLGPEPRGLLVYTGSGHMIVAIARAGRPEFEANDILRGSLEEKARAAETYLSYAGRYRVERDRVFHDVDISLFPNWVGDSQERIVERSGDRLVLSTDPFTIGGVTQTARMIWRSVTIPGGVRAEGAGGPRNINDAGA